MTQSLLNELLADPQARTFWQEVTQGQRAPSAEVEYILAQDILAAMGQVPAQRLAQYRSSMLSRAASRARALAQGGFSGPHDSLLKVQDIQQAWRGFFGVEVLNFSHRRYDGGINQNIRREVYIATDAVTVLPYDPIHDRVLLVEQIRSGPIARGAKTAWMLESIAGRIDPEDSPESAARREAKEEAGLDLQELIEVASFYPSPGMVTEYIYNYIALCDLPKALDSLHGLAEEGEDIRALTLSFNDAMNALRQGRIATAPLTISLLWLQNERTRLRNR